MDFKNRKICLFPQGLLHVFGQKFKICLSFLLRPNGPRRCVWWRSTQQNNLFRLQKHRFQIVEKFAFFQRGLSMVVVKVLKFLYPFLLGQRSLVTSQKDNQSFETVKTSISKIRKFSPFPWLALKLGVRVRVKVSVRSGVRVRVRVWGQGQGQGYGKGLGLDLGLGSKL